MKLQVLCLTLAWLASTACVQAQRDAPVWNTYLSPLQVFYEDATLSADFVFHKEGGPHEHVEHQCHVLMYLKQDEAAILKTISDAETVKKSNQVERPFLQLLSEQGLVVPLQSKVARRMTDEERQQHGPFQSDFCFPFVFEFSDKSLFQQLAKLKNFDKENVAVAGKSTWYQDEFGLMIFVPVNDSVYSTKVAPKIRKAHDFASVMDLETSILYFRSLPYAFSFRTYGEKLILHIN